jgi:hypothetical protein
MEAALMEKSTKARLADALLAGGLETFVTTRRQDRKSWRRISLDLRDAIDVEITAETLRKWFGEDEL